MFNASRSQAAATVRRTSRRPLLSQRPSKRPSRRPNVRLSAVPAPRKGPVELKGSNLKRFLTQVERDGGLPVFGINLTELKNVVQKDSASAQTLANVILRDPALTLRLLKMANAPGVTGPSAERILTVSHAIAMMGFDRTRNAALAMSHQELFQSELSPRGKQFENATTASLLSGIVAKDLAPLLDMDPEEAFVCAFLHRLGHQMLLMFLPEEYAEIQRLVSGQRLTEAHAAVKVIGITVDVFGQAVAAHWKLPPQIAATMEPLAPGLVQKSAGKEQALRHLSCFANELVQATATTNHKQRAEALAKLGARYRRSISLSDRQLRRLFYRVAVQLTDYAWKVKVDLANASFKKVMHTSDADVDASAIELQIQERIGQARVKRKMEDVPFDPELVDITKGVLVGVTQVPSSDARDDLEVRCIELVEENGLGSDATCSVQVIPSADQFKVPEWANEPGVSGYGLSVIKAYNDKGRPTALVICLAIQDRISRVLPKLG